PRPRPRPRKPNLPLRRGTVDFSDQQGMAALMELIGDAEIPPVEQTAAEPFVGVTTDGTPVDGLFTLEDQGVDPTAAAQAARGFLASLGSQQRSAAALPLDAVEWQLWSNAFLTFPEHGLQLHEISDVQRAAALAVIEASISAPGYEQLRAAMRSNASLGEVVGAYLDSLTEYCYWFTIFGEPSRTAPWGWQLFGHHIVLHCLFIGSQIVLTPSFLGTEFEGDLLFAEHQRTALEFMGSLTGAQRDRAVLHGSMLAKDLPHELAGIVDGRHRAGAGRDNLVLPQVGLQGSDLTAGQRELLMALADPYLLNLPETARAHRRSQLERHVDDSCLSWIGPWQLGEAFYYRLHSPVVLIEYDNHPGIFLDNDEPEPIHVHTIVRTPNGGDYGKDLLRRHYAQHHS
ncbi:DUF3500 domain-containing protein, partial [Streptomyces griseorubiginosus]|uniref:DUF3500 domain-containing protein n=1 Tax=Streptomyces griseorubiginosus TaxID=67304 RepID=UPI001AD67F99